MAKKRSSNQPLVAEEPARPEEQFRLDQSQTAPPSPRKTGTPPPRTSYSARATARSRATRSGRSDSSAKRDKREVRQEVVTQMLANPTKTVTEAELRAEYSYVVSDLRGMAIISVVLLVTLVVLAQLLPK